MALEELTIYNFTPDEIWMEQFVVAVCRSKKTESNRVKYWEIIADNLSKGWVEFGLRFSLGFQRVNDLD